MTPTTAKLGDHSMRSALSLLLGIGLTLTQFSPLQAQPTVPSAVDPHYANLAALPFDGGYPTQQGIQTLRDELVFERGGQTYIWALPALNTIRRHSFDKRPVGQPKVDAGRGRVHAVTG
jgi:hypothetical protein